MSTGLPVFSSAKRTLLQLVGAACGEIGLPIPGVVVSNPDLQVTQILALANREGQEAMRHADIWGGWPILRKEYTFAIVNAQDTYSLPSDYDRMIPQTIWDRAFRWQLLGPLEPQEWQVLKSGISPVGPRRRFRLMGGSLVLNPVPTDAGNIIAYEYISNGWCQSNAGTPQSRWAADTDTYTLEDDTMVLGIIWRFRKAKGLEYEDDYQAYVAAMDRASGRSGSSRSLPLGARASGPRLLGGQNVPDTGFGA